MSITFVAVSLLVDAVGSRVRGGPAASDASATTTTSSPPVTLVPLPSTPGVAPVVTRVETTDPATGIKGDDYNTALAFEKRADARGRSEVGLRLRR